MIIAEPPGFCSLRFLVIQKGTQEGKKRKRIIHNYSPPRHHLPADVAWVSLSRWQAAKRQRKSFPGAETITRPHALQHATSSFVSSHQTTQKTPPPPTLFLVSVFFVRQALVPLLPFVQCLSNAEAAPFLPSMSLTFST